MNTTPSTSEQPSYTVVGGEGLDRERRDLPGLSIVLLNRGARQFRRDFFEELCRIGAREVLCLETAPCPYDVEPLVKRHANLRFLIFAGSPNIGVRIDAAFREALCSHVFVLQGDMRIRASAISSRVFAKIAERGRICTVPVFHDGQGDILPTALGPVMPRRGAFDVQPRRPGTGEVATLAPWDYAGIYRKDKHMAVGGFDASIDEAWWQKLEYGMRCWLWGEELRAHGALKAEYIGEVTPEDSSVGRGYRRFFLKILAIRLRRDAARLPRSRWWGYLRASGESAGSTRETWRDVRSWVQKHRYRFVRDAAALTELWDWGE